MEEILQIKRNSRPTPQRKLIDSVGFTLKEYFAKTDQKPSLKSSNEYHKTAWLTKKLLMKSLAVDLKALRLDATRKCMCLLREDQQKY